MRVDRRIKIVRDRKGFTGLEAAIVLIAFVTVAAVFSYVMLGAGFFTAQKSKQSVDTGVKQASSSLELDGQYIYLNATDVGSNGKVGEIFFYVTLSAGGTPVDLDKTVLSIRYQNYFVQIPHGTTVNQINTSTNDTSPLWEYEGVVALENPADNLLEKNEKYKITINMSAIKEAYGYDLPQTNNYITIELKPSIGSPLIINKQVPPSLTKLTWV